MKYLTALLECLTHYFTVIGDFPISAQNFLVDASAVCPRGITGVSCCRGCFCLRGARDTLWADSICLVILQWMCMGSVSG